MNGGSSGDTANNEWWQIMISFDWSHPNLAGAMITNCFLWGKTSFLPSGLAFFESFETRFMNQTIKSSIFWEKALHLLSFNDCLGVISLSSSQKWHTECPECREDGSCEKDGVFFSRSSEILRCSQLSWESKGTPPKPTPPRTKNLIRPY